MAKAKQTPESEHERGSITFFAMGMLVVLLFVCGISIDLWRVFSERRALVEVADAAATAGSNGLDLDVYRIEGGELFLNPALAETMAWDSLMGQSDQGSLSEVVLVSASPDGIEVVLEGTVDLALIDLFSPGEPFTVEVRAEAAPRSSIG